MNAFKSNIYKYLGGTCQYLIHRWNGISSSVRMPHELDLPLIILISNLSLWPQNG